MGLGRLARMRERAKRLNTETYALGLAVRDPRTPWYAKAIALAVVAYALSPIDLIPDFIPLLGYVDDLIIVPAGIALAVRLIPREVLEECRTRAGAELAAARRAGRIVAGFIIAVWILVIATIVVWIVRITKH